MYEATLGLFFYEVVRFDNHLIKVKSNFVKEMRMKFYNKSYQLLII